MKIQFVNDYGFQAGGAELLLASERAELEARGHTTELLSLDSEELYGPANTWTHRLNWRCASSKLVATFSMPPMCEEKYGAT